MSAFSTYTDQELLSLLRQGDQRGFNLFFDEKQHLVYSIAYKMTRSRHKAKEVVQDVFLKIWEQRNELDQIENLGAYLNRLARNQSIDALRIIAREALRHIELKDEQLELGDNTTQEHLDLNETSGMIRQALDTLSPQQRRVYELCHEQGLKYEEAALEMGLSTGTVHSHMKQALKNIRIYLKNMDTMLLLMLLMHKM